MAISEAGSSSDAARASPGEYDVFLNFRGADTRYGFVDFIYRDLTNQGVHVFMDEEKLPYGEVIGEKLKQAIKNTIIYIPIFSGSYASSKWCLRELALMLDYVSESEGQKSILPIFFHVEPDDVKLKKPLYEADFKKHEEESRDEVEAWRGALRKVDERKGWVVEKNTSQAEIIDSVVKEVLEKLKIKRKRVTEYLVGLDDRIDELIELLDVNHDDVRLIGIYGIGGIGKTTIAKAVFNKLYSHFGKYCSFLEGIREWLIKERIVSLQKKLISDIGGSGLVENIHDSDDGMRRIEGTLSNKKVLVVLDDVDKKVPIEHLIGKFKLNRGTRIIITTRERDIRQVEGLDKIEWYEMQMMDEGVARRLFCLHAFGKDYPSDDYRELSREVVSLMGGLPLAIEVVGSLLKDNKDKDFWEETLAKLRQVPNNNIVQRLRISYDDLDDSQKQIFLDLACFFFDEKETDAIHMWKSCNFYPKGGIHVLKKRSLIKILDNGMFWMHDQLIALGKQIVREDSRDDLGKQSRLWIAEEARHILSTKEKKHMVKGLRICGSIRSEDFESLPNLRFLYLNEGNYVGDFAGCDSNLRWFSWCLPPEEDFGAKNLYLKWLVVCKLFDIKFKDDSKAWNLIKSAPNLKVLSFAWCSGITTIPDISGCSALERLTIGYCSNLKRIESFIEKLPSLIELKIERCKDFTDLPEEVGALVKLEHFSLSGCSMLRELPSSIGNLTSLTELDLTGTIVWELPNSIGKLKSLRILRYMKSTIGWEDHNWQFPSGISTLVNLEELDLSGHNEMKGQIPIGIGNLSSLRTLNLESTGIYGISRTINMLHQLQTLNLSGCHEIQELPELPTSLTCLRFHSKSLLSIPNLSNLTNLVELLLSNGDASREKSNLSKESDVRWIGMLYKLKKLELDLVKVHAPPELASRSYLEELVKKLELDLVKVHAPPELVSLSHLDELVEKLKLVLPRVPTPPELASLSHLEELVEELVEKLKLVLLKVPAPPELASLSHLEELVEKLKLVPLMVPAPLELASLSNVEELVLGHLDLKPLVQLPSSDWLLRKLSTLEIGRCEVVDIPLKVLPQLKKLTVGHCRQLQRLSIPLELTKIQQVQVLWCPELVEIQVVGLSKSLEILDIGHCEILDRIRGLSYLKNLEILSIIGCNELTTVEGLNELEFLKHLDVWKYPSLRSLINAACTKIPADCVVHIRECGCSSQGQDSTFDMLWKILVEPDNTSNEMEHPFTIDFIMRQKEQPGGEFSVTWGKKTEFTPDSVTYKRLIDEVGRLGFAVSRMGYNAPGEDGEWFIEIESDEQVKGMVLLASKRRSIQLIVDLFVARPMARDNPMGCPVDPLVFFFWVAVFLLLSLKLGFPRKIGQLAGVRGFGLCSDVVVTFLLVLFLFLGDKVERDMSSTRPEHFLILFSCAAVFLLLSLILGFPRNIGPLAGVRGFGLCHDFVVTFLLVFSLFLGVKVNWDGMGRETITGPTLRFLAS